MKSKIDKVLKKIIRLTGLVIKNPHDNELISKLKKKFQHGERGFVYGKMKYIVDCLYCHASPGVIETIITEFDDYLKRNSSGKKLLNLGGGTGQVADIYRALGLNVYNLDIAVEAEGPNDKQYDLNKHEPLPYEPESFDFVVCSEIIEHLENPWKLFRDAKRMLKKNGIFILSTPNIMSFYSRFLFFFRGYFKWFTPDCFAYHINPLPKWEIDLISEKTEFEKLKVLGSGDFFFNREKNNMKKIIAKNEDLVFIFRK